MWRFKPFMQKEQAGLEGRCLDVGNIKVHVKNVIAEGGFSSVYLARDAVNQSKLYALKHMICNDGESLDLVLKEISVMKSLKGHPNVVNLQAHAIFDMGRTKEAIIVMDFCEKSLVNVLESRGAGYFEEKQVLTIFRDICNAVFAMHCQSPPIAHRDLKAENLLLGSDGIWKLCDFGSTSTNHKRIEKPEEMGIEEDNIRKHTTPAYRAPEMWDLFRRDLISEKVDIWALGCLLFRICYFKSAFDGESKLQILNGNYRIPDLPKYSSPVTDLIQDMLQLSPEARPDITQVWFRVNELLPAALQKSLPDQPPDMCQADSSLHEGISKPVGKASVPRRTPASPPPSETQSLTPAHASGGGAPMGAFWSTQHAKDSLVKDDKNEPRSAEESTNNNTAKNILIQSSSGLPKDNESRFFQEDSSHENVRSKETKSDSSQSQTFQDEAFSAFVADFDTSKLSSSASNTKSGNKHLLEAEVVSLREQLRQVTLEKAEIGSKYEKLSAICRSQRQEIQELKQDLASGGRSTVKDGPNYQSSSGNISSPATQRDRTQGTVWELQQGSIDKGSTNMDSKPWQAFADDLSPQATPTAKKSIHSVRTRNGRQIKQNNVPVKSGDDGWGFGVDSFSAVPAGGSVVSKSAVEGNNNNNSQRFRDISSSEIKPASQPAGWAGF